MAYLDDPVCTPDQLAAAVGQLGERAVLDGLLARLVHLPPCLLLLRFPLPDPVRHQQWASSRQRRMRGDRTHAHEY